MSDSSKPVAQSDSRTRKNEVIEKLKKKIKESQFRIHPSPPKPAVLVSLDGKPICTAGNISNIQGPTKSAKSAVLGAMMAATVKALVGAIPEEQRENEKALLGFSSGLKPDPQNSVILHFDTEQSAHDQHLSVLRALGRVFKGFHPTVDTTTGEKNLPLRSYSMVHFTYRERYEAIKLVIESLVKEGKKFPCIFLDGVADIVSDPNNFEEARELVDWFHDLARNHRCAVITVLHENPSAAENGGGKTRGHLGSHIERKSETNLRVAKDVGKDKQVLETSTIWAERARHCYIPKHDGVKIAYNTDTKRHEIATGQDTATQNVRVSKNPIAKYFTMDLESEITPDPTEPPADVAKFLNKVFGSSKLPRQKELKAKIIESFEISDGTANNWLCKWTRDGWIFKGPKRTSPYSLTPFEEVAGEPESDERG